MRASTRVNWIDTAPIYGSVTRDGRRARGVLPPSRRPFISRSSAWSEQRRPPNPRKPRRSPRSVTRACGGSASTRSMCSAPLARAAGSEAGTGACAKPRRRRSARSAYRNSSSLSFRNGARLACRCTDQPPFSASPPPACVLPWCGANRVGAISLAALARDAVRHLDAGQDVSAR